MEQMDYKPNWFARGLNFNKTYTLALLIPNILNPVWEMAEASGIGSKSEGLLGIAVHYQSVKEKGAPIRHTDSD